MTRQFDKHSFSIDPRVIMCGSRDWDDREAVISVISGLPPNTTIVVGYNPKKKTPRGADRIIYEEGNRLGYKVETHPADWDKYKKGAGHIRNNKMARLGALRCTAFWDGASTGTKDMMDRAQLYNIPVEVIPWVKRRRRRRGSTQSR